jgi:XTP/dITP diphosphohydrolase
MDLLIATTNPGKRREYQELLAGLPLRLLDLNDVGLGNMDVEENGTTVEENAALKARAYAKASGLYALADDTGLFVDALGGAPGVYPARYGGPGLTQQQRRQKLLSELAGVPDEQRTARFMCVIALGSPESYELQVVNGTCEGRIAQQDDEGVEGFGYDAIFIADGSVVPWSRVPMAEKSRNSHRGQAARKMIPILEKLMTDQS